MPFPPPGTALRLCLADGQPVVLRPLTPADRERLVEGLQQLSRRSRMTRFFTPVTHLSEHQLRYLTEVDQERHVAWGVITDGEPLEGLGVGRFARLHEDPAAAEVAVTVVDAHQHRGIGTLLFAALYLSAQRLGVTRFTAYVLFENGGLVHALREAGGRLGTHEEGAVHIELPIYPTVEAIPETPSGRLLRRLLVRLEAALAEAL